MAMTTQTLTLLATATLVVACTTAPQPAPNATSVGPQSTLVPTEKPRIVKSRDGSYDGEMTGTPDPASIFAKIQIGMGSDEINKLMGKTPTRLHTYETGKRWIPFYYGNDAIRMQVLFEGDGCLIYATGNRFTMTSADLIRIDYDKTGTCYQP